MRAGTDLVNPGKKSGRGVISLPVASRAFLMSKQAAMPATMSHALLSPRARPGHILVMAMQRQPVSR